MLPDEMLKHVFDDIGEVKESVKDIAKNVKDTCERLGRLEQSKTDAELNKQNNLKVLQIVFSGLSVIVAVLGAKVFGLF